jgi:hypothetical protein
MNLTIPRTPLIIEISAIHIAAFCVVTVGCMVVDPFGQMNPFTGVGLLIYWFFINAASYLSGELVTQNVFRFRDPNHRPFLTIVVSAAVAAVLVGGNVSLVILVMAYVAGIPFFLWPTFMAVTKLAFLIGLGRLFFFRREQLEALILEREAAAHALEEEQARAAAEMEGASADQESALAKRLPAYLGDNILYMRSQDHYVEVVTDKGNHLIKMRFRDAMEEVEPLHGLQIHRGCWVRHAAVVRAKTHNRRLLVETSDGIRHPVSRSFVPEVRAEMRL